MRATRFGIIHMQSDGIPQVIEAAKDLAEAKAHILRLASREPGEFFIYSEKSGVIVERFVCVENEELLENDKSKSRARHQAPPFQYLS